MFLFHFIIFSIFFFNITKSVITHKFYKLIDAQIIQDQKNLFDNTYLIYSKKYHEQKIKIYGYDNQTVCLIDSIGDKIFISFESPYNYFATSKKLIMNNSKQKYIQTCFNHNGHTFLIFKNGNESTFIRSGNEKILEFNIDYKKIIFDHIAGKLYMQIDYKIYKIDLDIIEKLWLKTIPYKIRLKLEPIINLDPKWVDFIILNDTFFYINGHSIYKYFLDFNPSTIKSFNPEFISNINSEFFNFLLFPEIVNDGELNIMGNHLINIANNDTDSSLFDQNLLLIPLLIKFLIIAAIIFCFRNKILNYYNKKFKNTKNINNEFYLDDEPGIYPTVPLTKIVSAPK